MIVYWIASVIVAFCLGWWMTFFAVRSWKRAANKWQTTAAMWQTAAESWERTSHIWEAKAAERRV